MAVLVGITAVHGGRHLLALVGDRKELPAVGGVLLAHALVVALFVPWLPYGNGYHPLWAVFMVLGSDLGLPSADGAPYEQHEAWFLAFRALRPLGLGGASLVFTLLTLAGSWLLWQRLLPATGAWFALVAYAFAPVVLRLSPAATAKLMLMVGFVMVAMLGVELVRAQRRLHGWVLFTAGAWLALHTHRFGLGQVPVVLGACVLARLEIMRTLRDPGLWIAAAVLAFAMVRALVGGNLSDSELLGEVSVGHSLAAFGLVALVWGLVAALQLSGPRVIAASLALPAIGWLGYALWFGVDRPQVDTEFVRLHLIFDGAFSPGIWVWAALLGGGVWCLRDPRGGGLWVLTLGASVALVADRWDWGPSLVRGAVPGLWLAAPLVGMGLRVWAGRHTRIATVGIGLLALMYSPLLVLRLDEQQDYLTWRAAFEVMHAGEALHLLTAEDLGPDVPADGFVAAEGVYADRARTPPRSLTELLEADEVAGAFVHLDARCHRGVPVARGELRLRSRYRRLAGRAGADVHDLGALDTLALGSSVIALPANRKRIGHRVVATEDLARHAYCWASPQAQRCVDSATSACDAVICEGADAAEVVPFVWPACAAVRARFELEPVRTYRMSDRFFGSHNVLGLAPGAEVGLYRVVGLREADGPGGP